MARIYKLGLLGKLIGIREGVTPKENETLIPPGDKSLLPNLYFVHGEWVNTPPK